METGPWSPDPAALDCYKLYRSRVEAEDRWIVARIQTVIVSQGFLFAGMSAIVGDDFVSKPANAGTCLVVICAAAVGVMIGLFGIHGVKAAVDEIQDLCEQYSKARANFSSNSGLPWITGDPAKRHQPVNNRAIWFIIALSTLWVLIGLFAFHQIRFM